MGRFKKNQNCHMTLQIYELPESLSGGYRFWVIPRGLACTDENCRAKFKDYDDAESFLYIFG